MWPFKTNAFSAVKNLDAEAALRGLQEIGRRHPGWKGLGAEDQELISDLLCRPGESAPGRANQAAAQHLKPYFM